MNEFSSSGISTPVVSTKELSRWSACDQMEYCRLRDALQEIRKELRRFQRPPFEEVEPCIANERVARNARYEARESAAFTLVELLAVVAIILILVGITSPLIGYSFRQSSDCRVRAEIKAIENALEAYKAFSIFD